MYQYERRFRHEGSKQSSGMQRNVWVLLVSSTGGAVRQLPRQVVAYRSAPPPTPLTIDAEGECLHTLTTPTVLYADRG